MPGGNTCGTRRMERNPISPRLTRTETRWSSHGMPSTTASTICGSQVGSPDPTRWQCAWQVSPQGNANLPRYHLISARAANIAKGQSILPTMATSSSSHPIPQRHSSPTRRDMCSASSPRRAEGSLWLRTPTCPARAFCSSSRRFTSKTSPAPRRRPCPQYPE